MVTSGEDNSGLPGVNVVIKSTTIGASTNTEGAYSIAVPDNLLKNAVLIYSFIGVKTSELTPNSGTQFPWGFIYLQNELNSNFNAPKPMPATFEAPAIYK